MRFSVTATILHLVIGFITKISFVFPSSCYSSLGRTGKKQQISLAAGCWAMGTVTHEIGTYMSTVVPIIKPTLVFNCFSMIG